jgi:hypothetical protein
MLVDADGTNPRVVYPDGAGYALVTPTWSPDGKKLAFTLYTCDHSYGCVFSIYTINADGTGLSGVGQGEDPDWSPDGSRLAFFYGPYSDQPDIYSVRPDGTDRRQLTFGSQSDHPSWSPAGNKILFRYYNNGTNGLWAINADGTGMTKLFDVAPTPLHSAWSPDGTKISFVSQDDVDPNHEALYVANPDGTSRTKLFSNVARAFDYADISWQPIPINSYARPKGATPVFTSLTVAYRPCTGANRQHGPPLAALSCSPPLQSSDYLTVGTLDANGQKANSTAWVGQRTIVGNPSTPADEADVKLTASLSDVRQKDLSDYPGELEIRTTRRITDKDNTPAPNGGIGAATAQDLPFSATIPCATTSDTTIGSLCSLETTADALVPGSVKEGMRSIWELSQVEVYDGGSDGDADTSTDNTLFMDQGIFVP